ncbi:MULTISPECIES: hypothetical protein [Vitreoscilla]|uniref:Lipopolysaccharide core biosynthesis protein n=1 Tax=Vitreoscilla stercoraria TaxID=61 RepID=A0ABY4E9W0_VITST|nr:MULTISPECIES: hypothetical protein [Vitreoscilla]AUZ06094.1 hypothetical protein ADP71_28570 [Vitreoscilla sp. C1]UOO92542.1 hypothetical protein LVJ81_00380 [Vitreoscilla stercoraria]
MNHASPFRSLIKQVYRYSRARTYRHSEKIWPYVKIKRHENGSLQEVSIHGKPLPIAHIDRFKNPVCKDLLILASGPSINQTNLSELNEVHWCAVNGAVNALPRYADKSLNYYVVVDQGFVLNRIEMVAEVLKNPDVVVFTNVFCMHLIVGLLALENIKAQLVLLEDRQLPVYGCKMSAAQMRLQSQQVDAALHWHETLDVGFSLDLKRGYISGGTVVYIALQIACYLGYQKVYLAGVDMKNFQQPRFYETAATRLDTKLDLEFETFVYPSFALAADIYRQNNIEGYNLCLDSGLDDAIFPRTVCHHIPSL